MYTNQMLYWIISKCYKEKNCHCSMDQDVIALCDILLGYLNDSRESQTVQSHSSRKANDLFYARRPVRSYLS